MLSECVTQSKCYKSTNNFKYCVQEGADPECKAIRYDYFLCKRGQVFWSKSFSRSDNRSI
jgi:cytochrome c oxidase assembly factor 5